MLELLREVLISASGFLPEVRYVVLSKLYFAVLFLQSIVYIYVLRVGAVVS